MTVTLELYLRDQIIRGEMQDESTRRAIDLLNEMTRGVIELRDAWSGSVHFGGAPTKRGTVRVQRALALFVVPHDSAPTGPRQLRAGYVDKRLRPVEIGLGPFFVSGTMHVGPYDSTSIELSANDSGKQTFVPVTRAKVTSQYDATWSLDVGIVLVNRSAVSYVCSPSTPDPGGRATGGALSDTRTPAGAGSRMV